MDKRDQRQSFGRTIRDDLKQANLHDSVKNDLRGLREFFLDEDRYERLQNMGWFKRTFFTSIWLLQSLFYRLTPTRRILLIISAVLIIAGRTNSGNSPSAFPIIAFLILLFVLMLELKDKLLAHSELQAGRAVQNALMPNETPAVEGWSLYLKTRPANEVGGDLVDFIQLENMHYGLVLADVSGKGLGAALFMAKLQSTIRALAIDYRAPRELADKLNFIFHRDTTPENFASLLYMEIESSSGKIRFINAGHLPPLRVSAGHIQEHAKGSPAIGLSSKTVFKEEQLDLKTQETVIVYSDGLIEAMNRYGEFYGEQRLNQAISELQHLPAPALGRLLLERVDHFSEGAERHDDLSLVVLKRI